MNVDKSTYELLEPIIDDIDTVINIDSVVDNGSGSYTLNVCNTLWATQGFFVTIQGNQYKITAVVSDESITVSGTVLPITGEFDLYPPVFYHGTISVAESELNAKVNGGLLSIDKMPMIWLLEPVDETNDPDRGNSIARKSKCVLMFLTDANFKQWVQDDHYEQAIKPMRKLFKALYDAVKRSGTINHDLIEPYETVDLPRFGRYTGYTGAQKAIFAQYEMSGTKVTITLPFIRSEETCC